MMHWLEGTKTTDYVILVSASTTVLAWGGFLHILWHDRSIALVVEGVAMSLWWQVNMLNLLPRSHQEPL